MRASARAGVASGTRGFTLIELMIVIAIIAIIAAIAIPSLLSARKHANETAAVGALKTLQTAEALFRDGDKDGNGVLDYGSRAQLSAAQLIDTVLGSGTKQGYRFNANANLLGYMGATPQPEFYWGGMAVPVTVGTTGDRYFYTTQSGVIYYTTTPQLGGGWMFGAALGSSWFEDVGTGYSVIPFSENVWRNLGSTLGR